MSSVKMIRVEKLKTNTPAVVVKEYFWSNIALEWVGVWPSIPSLANSPGELHFIRYMWQLNVVAAIIIDFLFF